MYPYTMLRTESLGKMRVGSSGVAREFGYFDTGGRWVMTYQTTVLARVLDACELYAYHVQREFPATYGGA